MSFDYVEDNKDYSDKIGNTVRDANFVRLGVIEYIEHIVDGYGHTNAWAVLDNGRRINCRVFNRSR